MNQVNHVLRVGTQTLTTGTRPGIEALRVVGPARERLEQRLGPDQMAIYESQAVSAATPVEIGIATDKGLRHRNEDSAIIMIGNRGGGSDSVPIIATAIADGMGGHADGDKASAVAIETMVETMANMGFSPAGLDPDEVDDILTDLVIQAHQAVKGKASDGGSTFTMLLLIDDMLHVAHVGDSRAYLVRAGGLEILTHDHLLVRQMEEVGMLTREEAARHPQRHVLYAALGMDASFDIEVSHRQISSTSRLLLCTDGVWEALSPKDVYVCVALGQSPQEICERLILNAILRKAKDNATAVLLHLPGRNYPAAT